MLSVNTVNPRFYKSTGRRGWCYVRKSILRDLCSLHEQEVHYFWSFPYMKKFVRYIRWKVRHGRTKTEVFTVKWTKLDKPECIAQSALIPPLLIKLCGHIQLPHHRSKTCTYTPLIVEWPRKFIKAEIHYFQVSKRKGLLYRNRL